MHEYVEIYDFQLYYRFFVFGRGLFCFFVLIFRLFIVADRFVDSQCTHMYVHCDRQMLVFVVVSENIVCGSAQMDVIQNSAAVQLELWCRTALGQFGRERK